MIKAECVNICINEKRCKGCELCIDVCPKKIIKLGTDLNNNGCYFVLITDKDKCIACGACYEVCPDNAITIIFKSPSIPNSSSIPNSKFPILNNKEDLWRVN